MERTEELPALYLGPPKTARRVMAPDVETMLRTAILSGGVVLATSLIAVASATTFHIGPFTHKNGTSPSGVTIRLDNFAPPPAAAASASGPTYPPMLIAQDPGDGAWQRMMANASGAPNNLPLSVTTVGAMKAINAALPPAYGTMNLPPNWAKLSAIRDIGAWGPFVIVPGKPQGSLFSREPHEGSESAAVPTPVVSTSSAPATAADSVSVPAPNLTAAANPAPTAPPTPLSVVLPQSVPPVFFQASRPPSPPPPTSGSSSQPGTPPPSVSSVPEPASWIGFLIGFGLIGLIRRRTAKSPRDLHRNA